MIEQYGTKHEIGNLGCNFTDGGEGVKGFKRFKSEEERKKISDSKKRLYSDPLERKKLGEAIHKAKLDPVKLQNSCDAQKKRYEDPVNRQKMHDTNTQKKRVQQLTPEGEIVAEFPSMSYAVRSTGVLNVKTCCQGKRKFAGGFMWRYVV